MPSIRALLSPCVKRGERGPWTDLRVQCTGRRCVSVPSPGSRRSGQEPASTRGAQFAPRPRLVLPASEKFPQFLKSPSDTRLLLLGTVSSSLPDDVPPSLLPQLIHDIHSRASFDSPHPPQWADSPELHLREDVPLPHWHVSTCAALPVYCPFCWFTCLPTCPPGNLLTALS